MRVRVDPSLLQLTRNDNATEEAKRANEFFLSLAACNTIVPIVTNTSDPNVKLVDYHGESPDEQALVYAAAAYGFLLIERTSGHIVINVRGEMQRFNVLGLHEFDSDRKRMSVILGCPDTSVKLFVKGADSSMFSVMDEESYGDVIEATKKQLHAYSSDGLRTLVVGMRKLNDTEFEQWHSSFEAASTALIGRAGLLRKVAGNIETKLRIVGATAIEDKLQRGVPEAIESLRIAGIKVWVLTGDKQETAISIGFSSRLLTRNMRQIVINSNSLDSCRRSLEEANASVASDDDDERVALIIDGTSLIYVLDNDLEDVVSDEEDPLCLVLLFHGGVISFFFLKTMQLFQVACKSFAVLCCRVAPFQKAGIVALVKNRTSDMTLAIGDGN